MEGPGVRKSAARWPTRNPHEARSSGCRQVPDRHHGIDLVACRSVDLNPHFREFGLHSAVVLRVEGIQRDRHIVSRDFHQVAIWVLKGRAAWFGRRFIGFESVVKVGQRGSLRGRPRFLDDPGKGLAGADAAVADFVSRDRYSKREFAESRESSTATVPEMVPVVGSIVRPYGKFVAVNTRALPAGVGRPQTQGSPRWHRRWSAFRDSPG